MHMQSLLHSQWSTRSVPLLSAANMKIHPCLGHSQLVRTTSIYQYYPSHSHFASVGGDFMHYSPLVA